MKEIHYFLDSIAVQGLSDNTVQSYKRDLEKFSQFLEEQKVTRLQDVDHTTMVLFLQKLKKDEYAVSSRPDATNSSAKTEEAVAKSAQYR